MKRRRHVIALALTAVLLSAFVPVPVYAETAQRRIVILKVDGLNGDLLYRMMEQIDPNTGKSKLPWLSHIFGDNGTIFRNFYTRGISLSAPSWSMLDTGHHTVIRGNVEYDRYTGHVYDYLNFIPFYLGYAKRRQMDMPGVQVLDRAGIPLLIDTYSYPEVFQSFELFQRGVRWTSLRKALRRGFSTKAVLSMIEDGGGPSLSAALDQQTEDDAEAALKQPTVYYADFFVGDVDHEAHATNVRAALVDSLRQLDVLAARLWTAIQASPLASQTLFVLVSDHGMNNVPGVFSQGYSLPDLLNSREGGAHHVVTNRHQLQDFKLAGLDPLVSRVTNASTASFYLPDQADRYPTAWLDVDGNERAAVHLRNTDLNQIQILLQFLEREDMTPQVRRAAAIALSATIDRHRSAWIQTANELSEEMAALQKAIDQRKSVVAQHSKLAKEEQRSWGLDKAADRLADQLQAWERERGEYAAYLQHLRALAAFQPDLQNPVKGKIPDLVPELALGENNNARDLQHYVVGPASAGLVVGADGRLDEERSFVHVNYPALLVSRRVRNNPQAALSARPIDFVAMAVPEGYWLYGDEEHQLVICVDQSGRLSVKPIAKLNQNAEGKLAYLGKPWSAGFPLALYEDTNLSLPPGSERAAWLSDWHTEREWLNAIHQCRYSNGVISIVEELSPVAANVPGPKDADPVLLRYERRRRELVQADFHVFAADHWNFNVRNFNPGGNHGSFFRISTHSVWMLAGPGVSPHTIIEEPYDSLNFASTLFSWAGQPVPMPDRVVALGKR